jgi:hypothetical protein
MSTLRMAVRTHYFTLGDLRQDALLTEELDTTTDVELLVFDVIELHDPWRVLYCAVSTRYFLKATHLSP